MNSLAASNTPATVTSAGSASHRSSGFGENEVLHVGEMGARAQVYVEAGELRVDRARIVGENNHLWLIVFAHALDVHAVLAGSMHALMP